MSASRWRRWLGELAAQFGAVVEPTRGGHFAISHPSGWLVIASSTPSCEKAQHEVRSQVRRCARSAPNVIRMALT